MIFAQFQSLTQRFLKAAGIDTTEQRSDSTQIMPNIKRAGRLSLGYDVLLKAVKDCPEELLTGALLKVKTPEFKKDLLYRLKSKDSQSKLQALIELCDELSKIVEGHDVENKESIQILRRFIEEQALFDEELGKLVAKKGSDVSSDSLQSAHDTDATYRKKANKEYVGYVANLTETCSDENPVQMVTHNTLEKNTISDKEMLKDNMAEIKESGAQDLYVDGAYYGKDVIEEANDLDIELHYTDMTGTSPQKKIPVNQFSIEDGKIASCPMGHSPFPSYSNEDTGTMTAHFDPDLCNACSMKESCLATKYKNSYVVTITEKSMCAAETREKIKTEKESSTSKRAGLEGTNSVAKRKYGVDKLSVRGKVKCTLNFGLKMICLNFRQLHRALSGITREKIVIGPRKGYNLCPFRPDSRKKG